MNPERSRDLERRAAHGGQERATHRATVTPPVDVFENADELLVLSDVPGATNGSINVQLVNGELLIEARRDEEAPGTPVAAEYRPSNYARSFVVPQGIDASKI